MALCLRNLWFNWGSGLGFSPHMVHDTQSQKNWCPCLASLSTRHTWCTDIHAGKHLLHKIKTYDKSVFKRKRAIDVATRQILGPIRTFLDLGQPTGLTVSFYPLFMEWGDCLSLCLSVSFSDREADCKTQSLWSNWVALLGSRFWPPVLPVPDEHGSLWVMPVSKILKHDGGTCYGFIWKHFYWFCKRALWEISS